MKEPTASEAMEFPFEERELVVGDKKFRFRELSVQENDDCADSAKDQDGRINGRTMMRLMIIQSSVEPKLTPKMLALLPQRVYHKIYDLVNDLNDPETLGKDEGEGNA